jgi:hypothetical protein
MRPALQTAQMEVQMLLGLPNVDWSQSDYAVFLALGNMSKQVENPTRKQMLVQLGAWLRFYRRLLLALPEDHVVRVKVMPEFEKLAEPYQALLEVQK